MVGFSLSLTPPIALLVLGVDSIVIGGLAANLSIVGCGRLRRDLRFLKGNGMGLLKKHAPLKVREKRFFIVVDSREVMLANGKTIPKLMLSGQYSTHDCAFLAPEWPVLKQGAGRPQRSQLHWPGAGSSAAPPGGSVPRWRAATKPHILKPLPSIFIVLGVSPSSRAKMDLPQMSDKGHLSEPQPEGCCQGRGRDYGICGRRRTRPGDLGPSLGLDPGCFGEFVLEPVIIDP